MYTKKINRKGFIIIISLVVFICIILIYLSSAIGWYGYEKWKHRRSSFGNKTESIQRKVFVKELQYSSNVKLDSFNIYVEKGFKYGYHNENDTRLIEKGNFPYQISFTETVGLNIINYYVLNKEKYDSISGTTIYLKNKYLSDTLLIGINKYTTKWDSIGYIKVWDKDITKKQK